LFPTGVPRGKARRHAFDIPASRGRQVRISNGLSAARGGAVGTAESGLKVSPEKPGYAAGRVEAADAWASSACVIAPPQKNAPVREARNVARDGLDVNRKFHL
jgi:hypothetical protein